jgi:hypothetical protein
MVQGKLTALESPNVKLGELSKQKDQLYAKAAELSGLIVSRTRWVVMLNDLHQRLAPGMWLTSVRLIMPKDVKSTTIRLEVRGMAFSDKVSNQAITEYVAGLKSMGYFSDDLQIKRIKPVEGTDFATEFTVEIGLNAKPCERTVPPSVKAVEPEAPPLQNENPGKGEA